MAAPLCQQSRFEIGLRWVAQSATGTHDGQKTKTTCQGARLNRNRTVVGMAGWCALSTRAAAEMRK
eukprot:6691960-Pyramimonas_sp.AAC.1